MDRHRRTRSRWPWRMGGRAATILGEHQNVPLANMQVRRLSAAQAIMFGELGPYFASLAVWHGLLGALLASRSLTGSFYDLPSCRGVLFTRSLQRTRTSSSSDKPGVGFDRDGLPTTARLRDVAAHLHGHPRKQQQVATQLVIAHTKTYAYRV